jgi:hypothetical protein
MFPYTESDKLSLDSLFNRFLRESGMRDEIYPKIFSELLNATGAPKNLYVDANGNDANPGTIQEPFKTIQKAIDSIPKNVKHLINISIAAGNYAGFIINGFIMSPQVNSNPVGINMLGTRINATLASGTATGTITTTTAGNINTPAWTVITDSGQNWPVNGLKGLLFEVLTGTNAGSIEMIAANTATTITLETTSSFGSIGGTYAIRDWGTIINSPANFPGNLSLSQANPTATQTVGMAAYSNFLGAGQWLRVEGIKFNSSALTGINISQNLGTIRWDRNCISGGTTITGINYSGPGSFLGQSNLIDLRNAGALAVVINNPGNLNLTKSLITNLANTQNSNGILIQASGVQCSFSGHIDHHSFGVKITANFGTFLALAGASIETSASQAVLSSGQGHAGFANTTIQINGLECKNSGAGIQLEGRHQMQAIGLIGTGNTTGMILGRGVNVQIDPTSTITGTTEISMDGTSTTLAAMRAASPKLLTNTYGTIIFE